MVPAVLWRPRYHRRVRKLIKLALVALGIRAFLRWRKSRREAQATPTPAELEADPADELRRKLAESRDEVADEFEEPPVAEVADRRADVHEQGRATLDEMKSTDES
jgi:hypothetical protein